MGHDIASLCTRFHHHTNSKEKQKLNKQVIFLAVEIIYNYIYALIMCSWHESDTGLANIRDIASLQRKGLSSVNK